MGKKSSTNFHCPKSSGTLKSGITRPVFLSIQGGEMCEGHFWL